MYMDIQMQCFFNLAQTCNFSETAKYLYMSQQAVSKNIAKLESRLGFTLFYRNSHDVRLTIWGENFLEMSREYYNNVKLLSEDFQKDSHTFKILTLDQPDFEPVKKMHPFLIPGSDYYANISISFAAPKPGIEVRLSNDIDMLITIDRFITPSPGIVIYPIHSLEAALLVSKKHPKYKEGVDFHDFKNESFLAGVSDSNLFETRESIMSDITSFGLSPKSIIILPSPKEALAAAARGDGIILGSVMSRPDYEKELATIPTGVVNHIVCVWNENRCKTFSRAFAEFMKNEFSCALYDTDAEHA